MSGEAGGKEDVLTVTDWAQDRYASLELIGWWDQRRVRDATVLVAGAGALGNEVIKNLALLGVGRLLIIDLDVIDPSNLSRSLLFRESDRGRAKAEVAAEAARALNPDVEVRWIQGDLSQELGAGVFRRVDAVVGCLDNREARLYVNRCCYRVGRPWVDGAIQEMLGEARIFWPGRGACYECTLGSADYAAINLRYSCTSLARRLTATGRVATTTTIAAIIGGIESQEVMKLLHGKEVRAGEALVYNGLTNQAYNVSYPTNADCPGHQIYAPIIECPQAGADSTSIGELLALAGQHLDGDAVLHLDYDLLTSFECVYGHPPTQVLAPVTRVGEALARCPKCGSARWARRTALLGGDESFAHLPLRRIGVPPLALVAASCGDRHAYLELSGDAERFFS